ncbi:transmembrane protein, putative (macronuclear) [Tetrahymena thermophila SB210]|uniref:Transmembrane protein, putative n=1 Tax=Tetrahymena thermophila (strain SB210) TaxID=312017 RepID=W7WWG0_TETTS|nr:transmembrane protein, putative [Tetrahymena thermophila SB210]EWS71170.1 transmembrane protein, putative [Tetrahymena thermophila SB210]|eukprot:XP_012656311.1 transmembrane protein, putative [Tetrahymena thermophila SB210]
MYIYINILQQPLNLFIKSLKYIFQFKKNTFIINQFNFLELFLIKVFSQNQYLYIILICELSLFIFTQISLFIIYFKICNQILQIYSQNIFNKFSFEKQNRNKLYYSNLQIICVCLEKIQQTKIKFKIYFLILMIIKIFNQERKTKIRVLNKSLKQKIMEVKKTHIFTTADLLNSSLKHHDILSIKLELKSKQEVLNLTDILKQCTNLQKLFLHSSRIKMGDQIFSQLLTAVACCTNLQSLEIFSQYNELGQNGAQGFELAFQKCNKISNILLDFQHNQLATKGTQLLCLGLKNLTNLIRLQVDLMGNNIGNEGLYQLSNDLVKCNNLLSLTLILTYEQGMQKKSKQTLKRNIQKMKRLVKLCFVIC